MPRKAGPGRTPKTYVCIFKGIEYAHTAAEWQLLLGIRDKNTFYRRIKLWQANPRRNPLSWVFRCSDDAPFARIRSGAGAEPPRLSPTDAATMTALVESELGDIMENFK